MNNKILYNVTFKNIKLLGYPATEAKWIYNMYNKKHEIDGHAGSSYVYTNSIVTNINKNGFKKWSNHSVHIDYKTMFYNFYLNGFQHLGNSLLLHTFIGKDEEKVLKKFRKTQKEYIDLKIDISHKELLPLMMVIERNKTRNN